MGRSVYLSFMCFVVRRVKRSSVRATAIRRCGRTTPVNGVETRTRRKVTTKRTIT